MSQWNEFLSKQPSISRGGLNLTFTVKCILFLTQRWHCCHGCYDKLCSHCVEKTFQLGAMFRKVFGNNQCVILLIQYNVCLFVSVTQYSFRFRPVPLCNSILQVCANERALPCTNFRFQSVARSTAYTYRRTCRLDCGMVTSQPLCRQILEIQRGAFTFWDWWMMLHVNIYCLCDISEQIIFITFWCCWDGTRERWAFTEGK